MHVQVARALRRTQHESSGGGLQEHLLQRYALQLGEHKSKGRRIHKKQQNKQTHIYLYSYICMYICMYMWHVCPVSYSKSPEEEDSKNTRCKDMLHRLVALRGWRIHTNIYLYISMCICVFIFLYIYICIYIYICFGYVYIYLYIELYIYIYNCLRQTHHRALTK